MKKYNIEELIKQYWPKTGKKRKKNIPKTTDKAVLAGIIIGDIAGSLYEGVTLNFGDEYQTVDLLGDRHHFTDDSVMAIAICKATENCIKQQLHGDDAVAEYAARMREYAKMYPYAGYGRHFRAWALNDEENESYESFGDGSAMRSGVIGAMFADVRDVIEYAVYSALPTHSHPEGIKGAVVTAVLVWLALHGEKKKEMQKYICTHYPDIPETGRYFNQIYPRLSTETMLQKHRYQTLGVDCQTAVALAFINFFDTEDYERCLRNCLRYSSDTDTVMAISGGIATALYNPATFQGEKIGEILKKKLPENLLDIVL